MTTSTHTSVNTDMQNTAGASSSGGTASSVTVTSSTLPTGASTSALQPSLITTSTGTANRSVLVDPATGVGALVQAFHSADNQSLGTSYGIMTGGVDQILNSAGNLDRKREIWGDGQSSVGIAAEGPMLFNGTTYDRLYGSATQGAWVNVKANAALTDLSTSGSISALNANLVSGTATASSTVALTSLSNKGVASIQVTGVWVGTLIGQYSVDGVNWVTLNSIPFLNANTGAYSATIASASVGIWTVDISAIPNFRITSSAWTSGTAVITMNATQAAQMVSLDNPLPTGSNVIGSVAVTSLPALSSASNTYQIASTTIAAISGATAATKGQGIALLAPVSNVDKASSAVTTTGNTGTIADDFGCGLSALINITAVSGTTPTMDLILQESYDNGTTWQDVYHCPRFSATTTFAVPNMIIGGRRRWSYIIAGTTPSFTFSITTMRTNASPLIVRNFYDRTLASTQTLSATTGAFDITGCKMVVLSVCSGTATTATMMQLQFSSDGANWFTGSGVLTATASSTVAVPSTTGLVGKFIRAIVTTAGVSETITYVNFYGTN